MNILHKELLYLIKSKHREVHIYGWAKAKVVHIYKRPNFKQPIKQHKTLLQKKNYHHPQNRKNCNKMN